MNKGRGKEGKVLSLEQADSHQCCAVYSWCMLHPLTLPIMRCCINCTSPQHGKHNRGTKGASAETGEAGATEHRRHSRRQRKNYALWPEVQSKGRHSRSKRRSRNM